MSWAFLDGDKFTGSFQSMTFDGKDMWVSTGSTINVYSFWGEYVGILETITGTGLSDIEYMVKFYDTMYVFNNSVSQFIKINITSKAIEGDVTEIPLPVNCIPAFGNGKFWFVTGSSLFFYDPSDSTWSTPVTIPGRTQTNKRKILWGRAGFVYVLNVNESGVSKFNDDTGAHVANISTNRAPATSSHITTNDSFQILISGFNGMVSSVDQVTDTPTNISGLGDTTDNFIDDGTYLWTIKPSVARIDKSTTIDNYLVMASVPAVSGETHQAHLSYGFALSNENVTSLTVKEGATTLVENVDYTFGIDPAWAEQRLNILLDAPNITGANPTTITVNYSYQPELKDFEITGFSGTSFIQVLTTPEYTHQYWDADTMTVNIKTEEARIVLLASNAIYFAYNFADSWGLEDLRAYELSIKGTALVGTGAEAYHGETV